jgi:hypothetical protein
MQERNPAIDSYLRSGMHSVAGYMKSVDAKIIASILAFQHDQHIAGNLCEIGVHHGRLFLLLALARNGEERAVGIDLFEDDDLNASSQHHRGRNRALAINARRFGIPFREEEIVKNSSLDIVAEDIMKHTGGPIRLFSVDGGHDYRCVENDLLLAKQTISHKGVIAVDDFFNPEWPEVTLATCDFLRGTDELIPFLISPGKLYLTTQSMAASYQQVARNTYKDLQSNDVQFLRWNVCFMRDSNLRRIVDHFADMSGRWIRRQK